MDKITEDGSLTEASRRSKLNPVLEQIGIGLLDQIKQYFPDAMITRTMQYRPEKKCFEIKLGIADAFYLFNVQVTKDWIPDSKGFNVSLENDYFESTASFAAPTRFVTGDAPYADYYIFHGSFTQPDVHKLKTCFGQESFDRIINYRGRKMILALALFQYAGAVKVKFEFVGLGFLITLKFANAGCVSSYFDNVKFLVWYDGPQKDGLVNFYFLESWVDPMFGSYEHEYSRSRFKNRELNKFFNDSQKMNTVQDLLGSIQKNRVKKSGLICSLMELDQNLEMLNGEPCHGLGIKG